MSLAAQVSAKLAGKRDTQLESEILQWIAAIVGEPLPAGSFEDVLKDGIILCKLMNKLAPGSCKKIATSGPSFKLMENINTFQTAARNYGVPEIDVFQTVDLFEKRNIPQVTQCLLALGRTCYLHSDFNGPYLGPKPSEECKRDFSEEQLRASDGIISLQYGSNKGANQSGQNFGNSRHM
ncbi:muscle-specific protein 20-like [Panonychus citri]|uniref:muscle-specific protein 20-like n=1 Tax=Panonychus citri TaxID=50023 RepID=UPI002307189A|nr:muscle-specific protein 20-like [Panonychus citri]